MRYLNDQEMHSQRKEMDGSPTQQQNQGIMPHLFEVIMSQLFEVIYMNLISPWTLCKVLS